MLFTQIEITEDRAVTVKSKELAPKSKMHDFHAQFTLAWTGLQNSTNFPDWTLAEHW